MSKSKNEFHPLMRNRSKKFRSNPFRKRKHYPYGGMGWCGYGGEMYCKNPYNKNKGFEEIVAIVINKRKARNEWKKNIKKELELE